MRLGAGCAKRAGVSWFPWCPVGDGARAVVADSFEGSLIRSLREGRSHPGWLRGACQGRQLVEVVAASVSAIRRCACRIRLARGYGRR